MKWGDVPSEKTNGVIEGYRVFFWRARHRTNGTYVDLNASRHSVVLDRLSIFTDYIVSVRAKTAAPEYGVESEYATTKTLADGKQTFFFFLSLLLAKH